MAETVEEAKSGLCGCLCPKTSKVVSCWSIEGSLEKKNRGPVLIDWTPENL